MLTSLSGSDVRIAHSVADATDHWRQAVEELTQSNLAHSPEWFTVIRNAYGHDPLYLCGEDGEGRPGLLPAFVVRRPFVGTIVTSMPFLDTGGPCCSSVALGRALVQSLIAEARRIGARVVELRCTQRLDLDSQPMEHKVGLTLPLPSEPERLWRQLDGGVRNQIRKAERSGLSVEFGGVEKLATFYETFVVRMRDLGSPVHAPRFLRAVLEGFGRRARIAVIRKGNTPVGGLIALSFKDTVTVPWASCLQDYFSLCPNMLLYWETLRKACSEGFRRFDFGRSTRHSGTYRFKRQWGAQEESLFWYTIPIAARRSPTTLNASRAVVFLGQAWQRLPLSLTRHLGPPIRKYLTQ